MENEKITIELTELDEKGKPFKSKTKYLLVNAQDLFSELVQALDFEQEQGFEIETKVNAFDTETGETIEEFYLVRFTRNRGWGLMGKMTHPKEGVFRFYLDFLTDGVL